MLRYQYGPRGQRQLVNGATGIVNPFGLVTDDLGQFRAYGLRPGDYILSASLTGPGSVNTVNGVGTNNSATSEGYAPTYYPGTISSSEAEPISVGIGQEATVYFSLTCNWRLPLI